MRLVSRWHKGGGSWRGQDHLSCDIVDPLYLNTVPIRGRYGALLVPACKMECEGLEGDFKEYTLAQGLAIQVLTLAHGVTYMSLSNDRLPF